MRLTDAERMAIREAVAEVYGPEAVVRLFGSRVHDHLRGGDIDLHVEASDPDVITLGPGGVHRRRCDRLWQKLQDRIGECKIDIVDTVKGEKLRSIDRAAFDEGLRL